MKQHTKQILQLLFSIFMVLVYSVLTYAFAIVLMVLIDIEGLFWFGQMVILPSWYAPLEIVGAIAVVLLVGGRIRNRKVPACLQDDQ